MVALNVRTVVEELKFHIALKTVAIPKLSTETNMYRLIMQTQICCALQKQSCLHHKALRKAARESDSFSFLKIMKSDFS